MSSPSVCHFSVRLVRSCLTSGAENECFYGNFIEYPNPSYYAVLKEEVHETWLPRNRRKS